MTESDWCESRRVGPMLAWLRGTPGLVYKRRVQQHPRGRRRLLLFRAAVARSVLYYVAATSIHRLVAAVEELADGNETAARVRDLHALCGVELYPLVAEDAPVALVREYLQTVSQLEFARQAAVAAAPCGPDTEPWYRASAAIARAGVDMATEIARQAALLRDIFGNPFRPITFDPTWRTDTAVILAQQMYDSRNFGAMPILADALQDAGCESAEVLNHCRDPHAAHVRGCWVVDLVLGLS